MREARPYKKSAASGAPIKRAIYGLEVDATQLKKDLYRLARERSQAEPRNNRPARTGGYLYLYDDYLKNKEYAAILANIERRLSDFEIGGKILRLSTFTNARLLVEDEMRNGIKTVVLVGNDETLSRIWGKAADLEVVYGFLPVGIKKNTLAEAFGIPLNEKSCEVLAARKIEKIDFGVINKKNFFLSGLHIPSARLQVNCDDQFKITTLQDRFEASVANLQAPPFPVNHFQLRPQDGKMEFCLRQQPGGLFSSLVGGRKKKPLMPSIFFFKHLTIKSDKAMKVIADGREFQDVCLDIEVGKKKIALIVGKGRKF